MRDSGFFDVASARKDAAKYRISRHRSGSTDAGKCTGQKPSISSRNGPGRGSKFRRLNDSLIGDVIGALALFAVLIGGMWIGAALS